MRPNGSRHLDRWSVCRPLCLVSVKKICIHGVTTVIEGTSQGDSCRIRRSNPLLVDYCHNNFKLGTCEASGKIVERRSSRCGSPQAKAPRMPLLSVEIEKARTSSYKERSSDGSRWSVYTGRNEDNMNHLRRKSVRWISM